MTHPHEKLSANAKTLDRIMFELSALSDAAGALGMTALDDALLRHSVTLGNVARDLHAIGGEIVTADIQHFEASSQNILNAALAGVELAKQREREGEA